MAAEIPRATVQRVLKPEDWRKKQLDTLKSVGRKNYLLGIAFPSKDPIAEGKSDAAEARYAAMTRAAIDAGSRKAALDPLTIEDWYPYARDIGADILVDGVTKRETKVAKFVNKFQPELVTLLTDIDKKPVETLEERITKSADTIRGLAALRGVWKGK